MGKEMKSIKGSSISNKERKRIRKLVVKSSCDILSNIGYEMFVVTADRENHKIKAGLTHNSTNELILRLKDEFIKIMDPNHEKYKLTQDENKSKVENKKFNFKDLYLALNDFALVDLHNDIDNAMVIGNRRYWFSYSHGPSDEYYSKYFTVSSEVFSIDVYMRDEYISKNTKLCRIDFISNIAYQSGQNVMFIIILPYLTNGKLPQKTGLYPINEHTPIDPDSANVYPWHIYMESLVNAYLKSSQQSITDILDELFVEIIKIHKDAKERYYGKG